MFSGLRSLWKRVAERVYDVVASRFRDQEEIDDIIAEDFSEFGTFIDPVNKPTDAKLRHREFYSPEDARAWLRDAAIPPTCVFIMAFPDWDDEGNTMYKIAVLDDTP